jgi:hypothetical protein
MVPTLTTISTRSATARLDTPRNQVTLVSFQGTVPASHLLEIKSAASHWRGEGTA